jgi:fumarylacetoacetate (FAA) hydrolase
MKLGSLKRGGRDGTLVVVSHDLTRAVRVPEIARTMQAAIEDWDLVGRELRSVGRMLDEDRVPGAFPLDIRTLASPLPRAYQWADGSAYLNHVELVRKARGAELPPSFLNDPLMYQGGSDSFLAPTDPIRVGSEEWGIDFESEVAVIVDDVPMGVTPEAARSHIKLVMLANDVSLRNLIPNELAKGFGFFHGKPPTAFSPVAVDLEGLGGAWDGGKLYGPLLSTLNGKQVGWPDTGADMQFDFPALIAHAAKTRPLSAGTIIGSGTVSNRDRARGWSCIAEVRMIEIIEEGQARTPFMRFDDTIHIEMKDADGHSIFGAIDQTVVRADWSS